MKKEPNIISIVTHSNSIDYNNFNINQMLDIDFERWYGIDVSNGIL